jgi:hypothetical protein
MGDTLYCGTCGKPVGYLSDAVKMASKEEFITEWKRRCPCKDCAGVGCEECVWCADPCKDRYTKLPTPREGGKGK